MASNLGGQCDHTTGGEAGLAARFVRQEPGAFEELIERYKDPVCHLVTRLLSWSSDSEDVVQDVFLTAFEKAGRFRGDSTLWTWLTAITLNRCRTVQRRRVLWRQIEGILFQRRPPASPRVESTMERREAALLVREALATLPAKDREVIVLHYFEHYSTEEIGRLLHRSTNAIEVRLHRARARLRRVLESPCQGVARGY